MAAYAGRRIALLGPVLFGVSVVVFMMLHLTPGDPARMVAGINATPEQVEEVRRILGLDQPLHIQYLRYVRRLLQGDMGRSLATREQVLLNLWPRYLATVELTAAATVVAVTLGLTIGIVSATRQYSFIDSGLSVLALVGISTPAYWLGLMLMLLFSLQLGWLPSAGRGGFAHLILPAITLGTLAMAVVARMTRASMLDVLNQEYVQAARAKGLRERVVLARHALKNALIPVITVIGLQTGQLLGGAVLTETVFAWPGIGRFLVDAIKARDFPIVQGGVLISAVTFVVVNLVVDLLYSVVDPRIRYSSVGD
ncbi:MAG: ABC transporter permease [Armatimonadetes bacterium]|nr:ABC transporter permease [Armatimonadota bacterium]